MTDLTLYTHPMSRGRTVRWLLEEIGAPYRVELLEYGTTMKAAPYLAVNPLGKVPALQHGPVTITESAAICAYLADAFPAAGLAPAAADPQRGPYFRWLFFAAGPLESAIVNQTLGFTLADEQKKMVGYGPISDMLDVLEQALSNADYLLGDRFSTADIYVGSLLAWATMTNMIEQRPCFEQYIGRLRSRPAAVRAAQMDDALLK